jgi:hypothetical protein
LEHGADAVVSSAEKVGTELGAMLNSLGIRERKCVICVPASWALTTATDIPELNKEDLAGYLELRAERELPAGAADSRLSHCTYELPDGKRRATIAALPIKRVDAVQRMLAAAGCRPMSLSLGLDACIPKANNGAALHFLANGTHIDLVIASGGGIAAVRSLPGVAQSDSSTFDPANFSREVRITLGRLPDSVRQQVREARFAGTPVSASNLRKEIGQHLERMGIDARLDATGENWAGKAEEAGVVAAEHHLRNEPVAFEFLPPQVNRWQVLFQRFDSKRRRLMVAVGAGVLILPVLIY